ncbi:antA/AntB antirepressor family protein [Enterococcus hirae]|uniref:antA/AntB antirepressor family protein n=1 Tax=Enterococcus hirae TaxID=1354 RepID=UPI002004ACC4|nr:antA/AntB antirepressor family protein [Enterococcus hirae]MCK6145668.1 antA/AntB antirepressor family protein [Enterococcus hirae]MCK6173114.1 antA/AntB antirepressor family protein [Enterococcus hirae]
MKELIKVTTNEENEQLVSGRELHEFLEVKERYNDWFPRMREYGFYENVDFISFTEKSVKGGRPQKNHFLKLDMAKEISMLQRTEKGKQARQYFIQVEKEYKQQLLDTSKLSPELQMFQGIFNAVAKQELETKRLATQMDNITEIVALNTTDWRRECRKLVNKMAETQGGYGAYQEIQTAIYEEVDRRAGSSLKTRLTNLRNRMAGEGVSKSKRDKTNKLDVIESDKRLTEIYLSVVKDFAIKYGVWKEK